MYARPADAEMRAAFDVAAAALGSVLDVAQEPVADRLTLLGDQLASRRFGRWRRLRVLQGVYLHGPVGRGKTWLVDVLLGQLPVDGVLRLHAYDAARQLHAQVARQAGSSGATERAVNAVLAGVRLLFLDELHAHDPGDAMLLSRLVHALPSRVPCWSPRPTTRRTGSCPTRATTRWCSRWSPPSSSTAKS